jgi:hypothetical protein
MDRVQVIGLESDYGVADSGGDLGTAIHSDDDVTVIKDEIDKLRRRQRPPGKNNPAHGHGCQQVQAFNLGQLLQRRIVGVHIRRMRRNPAARPGNKVLS